MTTEKNPAPRANAGSRANFKVEQHQTIASSVDWEADPAAIWFARRFAHADGACARPGRAGEPGEGLSMKGPIDFAEINRAALAAFPAVLARILPGGKRVGAEIVALNPRRADRQLGSFKVNRYNGRWATSRPATRAAIPFRLSPISRMFRRARRRGCSRKCSAWKPGGAVMDDASNPFAPLTPAELAEAARQNEQSIPSASAPSRHARRPMRNPERSRRRGCLGASPMVSGATRLRKTKPPFMPRAGMRRTGKRPSARSHGASGPAGNSRLGRIIGRCSTCPISSRIRARP